MIMDKDKLIEKLNDLRDKVENGNSHWRLNREDADDQSKIEMDGYDWAISDVLELIEQL